MKYSEFVNSLKEVGENLNMSSPNAQAVEVALLYIRELERPLPEQSVNAARAKVRLNG